MPRRTAVGVVLAACLLLTPSGARAAEFTVNATGDHTADACDAECTVRDAIAAANGAAGADTITVPAGTYALSFGALVVTGPVTISGPATAQPTAILDAAYSNRIFDVDATATISHLRVTRGQSPDVTGGSGLLQRGGTVTLQNDVFDALSNSVSGGALVLQSGTLNVIETEVRDNNASRGGGLFVAGGTANVDRTLWLNNDGSTGGGGAIYNNGGTLTVTNSTFAANTVNAGHGGAIYAAASTALRNVTFEANSASGNDGGGSALWVAAATTTANVLFGNSAYQDNCGGSPPNDLGGSIDTGTSCGLTASERTVLLGPLALGSLLPWAGSAGIDAGDNAQCLEVDQRGTARPHTAQNPCDTGAVEGSAGTAAPAPLVAGGAQRDTTRTATLLDATIDRRGIPTTYAVEYGLTTAYGSVSLFGGSVAFGSGAGPQEVSDYLDELQPGTTYHYRFVATSAGGTTRGEDRTFLTVGPPQVATRDASGVSETGATLTGTVNPAGDDTTYWFEYGPTAAYGRTTPATSAGAAFAERAVSAVVSGLDPNATYHFRLVAMNEFSGGPVTGADRTFTTATPPPVITVPTVTAQPTPTPTPTPTPAAGTVVARPVSGKVLVRRPGSREFVELDATAGIPDGSTIDTKRGVVELTSQGGTAQFRDGIFRINRRGSLTDLTLTEALAPCKRSSARASAKKPKSRKLWGKGSGKFRTIGQYSAATVRGTRWLVQDSCAGTRTRVTEGSVAVRDRVRGKTILVRAGKSYLARPRRG